jgi:hypothetical protein
MSEDERVLIYLGPTLPKEEAIRLIPYAIFRPPAKQSDIISDIVQLNLLVGPNLLHGMNAYS